MSTAGIIAIVAVVITVGSSVGLYKAAEKNMRHVHGLVIPSVDLSELRDSTYRGSYSYIGMSYKVAVTVKDHRIERIDVIKNGKRTWAKMAEGVIPRVIEAQNTTVDAVAGATTTSKAMLMAIHDALTPERKR